MFGDVVAGKSTGRTFDGRLYAEGFEAALFRLIGDPTYEANVIDLNERKKKAPNRPRDESKVYENLQAARHDHVEDRWRLRMRCADRPKAAEVHAAVDGVAQLILQTNDTLVKGESFLLLVRLRAKFVGGGRPPFLTSHWTEVTTRIAAINPYHKEMVERLGAGGSVAFVLLDEKENNPEVWRASQSTYLGPGSEA